MINGEIARGVYKTYGIIERWVAFQWVYSGSTVGLQWVYNEQKTKEWWTKDGASRTGSRSRADK